MFAAVAAAACGGGSTGTPGGTPSSGSSGTGGAATATSSGSGLGGDISLGGGAPKGPFSDFPKDPIIDPSGLIPLPANIGDLFGPAGSGDPGGPCLVEPEPGTLFPNNWLRPRFRAISAKGENVFEIRIHAPNELHDLVVYTSAPDWKMPKDMWAGLTQHLQDQPLTVTIRGAGLANGMLSNNPTVGTSGDIRIAPADAAGAVVYWRTVSAQNTGELKGFSAGDESVALVLPSDQVQVKPKGKSVTCIGCHTSTPDGQFAAFKTLGGTIGGALGSVQSMDTGAPPAFWSKASIDAMNAWQFGIPSFSKAHWAAGDHLLLTSWDNSQNAKLAWFDLEASAPDQGVAYDFLDRAGDSRGAIMPAWSHDGKTIVYTSTNGSTDGRPTAADTDLYTVPFGAKKGGVATPLMGAADPAYNEYYPALSPDDQLVAFNRIPEGQNTYNQPNAEVFVLPTAGGTPVRLAANDPVACSGSKSPGITNSWPKWAPEATTVAGKTYYWLIFSSQRGGSKPQLYVTGVVVEGGQVQSYPALYLWNQPADEANHTPAWDVFLIQPPPPPQ